MIAMQCDTFTIVVYQKDCQFFNLVCQESFQLTIQNVKLSSVNFVKSYAHNFVPVPFGL